jgi:hypothetical protein
MAQPEDGGFDANQEQAVKSAQEILPHPFNSRAPVSTTGLLIRKLES